MSNNYSAYDDAESDGETSEEEPLPEADLELLEAITRNDVAGVRHALRNGANVNVNPCSDDDDHDNDDSPLMKACMKGYDDIVRILLNAGADAQWADSCGWLGLSRACKKGHLATVEILLNHDKDLLEIANKIGETPLCLAIACQQFEIVHFLLDQGANALATNDDGLTALMFACCKRRADLELVRRLLAAGVPVDAREKYQQTALHHAAPWGNMEVLRELIVEQNANMFVVDVAGKTPFDKSYSADGKAFFIECYGNKLTQEHGRLALHAVLAAAEYTFIEEWNFHPPLNPLRIQFQLGKLTLQHFRALIHSLGAESIHNRDAGGKLPIHIACQANALFEVLSVLVEMDPATLQIADNKGALPIHLLCGNGTLAEYASMRYLVEQGGGCTLAARNQDGAMPLHVLCGSQNPSLRTVQYMIQSFPESMAAQTNDGQYPVMIAACESSTASLSVVYELVRTNAVLVAASS